MNMHFYYFTLADATTCLCKQYINSRFATAEDDWPPYQPKHYTTLAFIHHEEYTDVEVISVTQELVTKGDMSRPSPVNPEYTAKTMKTISDIFAFVIASNSGPKMLLIEGAPGMGKTVLSKEIAFQWATGKLLNSVKFLLLVFLRNFNSSNIKSVESFMQHVFKNGKVANDVVEYVFKNDGEDLAIVLDGYDEMSENDRIDSFIADIIKRVVLPQCLLVITSRPTASSRLHSIANCRVEIIGFTEEDRLEYIKVAMPDSPEKVEALQLYLQSNPTINALCYIPLNMTILLCLSIMGIENLPKAQTELYKRFIEMTVIRFLQKQDDSITAAYVDLYDLPYPHSEVFNDLSHFAFRAMENDKLVFTLAELKANCSSLTKTPNSLNGLGLLKSVKYFDYSNSKESFSCHFLHFSIQEYMAAYYISKLPNSEQIRLLKNTFWTIRYYNTWIMYVGITGGQSFALKHFLSGNWFQFSTRIVKSPHISKNLINNKIKSLHIFQCLEEANDISMISSIGKCFHNQEIDLSNQTLLLNHLNMLGFFLARSVCKHWKRLELSKCSIGDTGCTILSEWFLEKGYRHSVNIECVDVSYNQFGLLSLVNLFRIFKLWCTSEIIITDSAISDSTTGNELYGVIESTFIQPRVTSKFNNKIKTLKVAVIGSFLFANNLNQQNLFSILFSKSHNIKSVYLLNINWVVNLFEAKVLKIKTLLSKLNCIHFLGTALTAYLIKVAYTELAEEIIKLNSLFIFDSTLLEKDMFEIGGFIKYPSKSGVYLIISHNKIRGTIHTFSLRNELSKLEILNLITTMRSLSFLSSTAPWREDLHFYGNISEAVIQSFVDFLYKITYSYYLTICLVEDNTLIAHNVGYGAIDKIDIPLVNVYLSNCYLNIPEYLKIIARFKQTSQLYIINGQLTFRICHKLLKDSFHLKELFLHNVCTLALGDLEALNLLSVDWNINVSTVLVANNELFLHNPTSEQLAVVLKLNLFITKWKFLNCQLKFDTFYQIVTILTSTSMIFTALEIHLFDTYLGNIESKVVLEHIINSSTFVSKLNISFSELNFSMMPVFVNIVCAWKVEELVVCYQHSAIFTCLIKKLKKTFLIKKHHVEATLSTAYGRCFTSTIRIEKQLKCMHVANI